MAVERVSPVPREARAYQGQRAGVVTRLVAAVLDGVVVVLLLTGAYAAWAGLLFLIDPRGFIFPSPGPFSSFLAGFVVTVAYCTLSWWLGGRSYGCVVMGLRVLGPGGRPLRLAGALARAVVCAAFPIGLLWVAVNRNNRSVADLLLRTSVVYDWQVHPNS